MDRIKIEKPRPSQPIKIEAKRKKESSFRSAQKIVPSSLERQFHGFLVSLILSLVFSSLLFAWLPDFKQLKVLNYVLHWFLGLLVGGLATFVLLLASNHHDILVSLFGGFSGGIGILFGYLIRANQNNLSYWTLLQEKKIPVMISVVSCFLGAIIVFQKYSLSKPFVPELEEDIATAVASTQHSSSDSRLKLAPKTKKKHRRFRPEVQTKTKIDPHAISYICPICYDESDLITNSSRNFIECEICGARHHRACWESNAGCGTLSEH